MKCNISICIAVLCLAGSLQAQQIQGTGSYKVPNDGNHNGFDRGMQATMYCGNSPESWFRGSATLDRLSGHLDVTLQLETDSVQAGPRGKLHVTLYSGCFPIDTTKNPAMGRVMFLACRNPATKTPKAIYQVDTDEVGIGGKGSGKAAIIQRDGSVDVPQDLAAKVTQVKVEAECTGSQTAWFGWLTSNDVHNAFKFYQQQLDKAEQAAPAAAATQ